MSSFPDTSFLCAIYRKQDNSAAAAAFFQGLREPLPVSGLVLYEFRQSTRLQIWLHGQNPRKGFPEKEGKQALADLDSDLAGGVLKVVPVEWLEVHGLAERLSAAYAKTEGHRTMDILHVATALVLKAEQFLTFDGNQRRLAQAQGMKAKP
jgi:predicted nucleic acid-binding protein